MLCEYYTTSRKYLLQKMRPLKLHWNVTVTFGKNSNCQEDHFNGN